MTIELKPDTGFAIVGAGRVGTSLGVLLQQAGHRIVGCSARSSASLERAVSYLNCPSSTELSAFLKGADCILITVPDDSLSDVAEELALTGIASGRVFLHAAGSLGLGPLKPCEEAGGHIAAAHVLQSVPDVEAGIERIPGSWFGVTAPDPMRSWVESYVVALRGKTLWVPEEGRTLYHAAAVFASNYVVALSHLIGELGENAEAYLPLARGTLDNIDALGAARALTGPVARGDYGTLARHIEAIGQVSPEALEAYKAMGMVALSIARKRDGYDSDTAQRIEELMRPR